MRCCCSTTRTRPPSTPGPRQSGTALAPTTSRSSISCALDLQLDKNGVAREHFGFADGLSQPIPFGAEGGKDDTVVLEQRPAGDRAIRGMACLWARSCWATPMPMPKSRPVRWCRTMDCRSTCGSDRKDGAPEGFFNLGLNGSYMVVRELRQYVARFWKSLEATTPQNSRPRSGGDARHDRLVGRTHRRPHRRRPHVVPQRAARGRRIQTAAERLRLCRNRSPRPRLPGRRPVRRANPRDGLAKDPASAPTLLDAANNHRILRRGRKYGAAAHRPPHRRRRGTRIALHLPQRRHCPPVRVHPADWLLNKNFATLYDETDPLMGPKGRITIPEEPLRRIVEVRPSSNWPAASISFCQAFRP